MLPINLVAVLVAGVVVFIIGFLLHGPISGKLWMKLANITPTGNEKFSDMYGQMLWNLVANFVTAFVMAMIFALVFTSPLMGPVTWCRGAITGALIGIGFIMTGSSMEVIWMGRSWKLWLFEVVSSLIMLASMGAILASW